MDDYVSSDDRDGEYEFDRNQQDGTGGDRCENFDLEPVGEYDDEATYKLLEKIEEGVWPIEIPYALENTAALPHIKLQRKLLPSLAAPKSPREIVRVTMRLDQARVSDLCLEHILFRVECGRAPLECLPLLCRIDPERFLDITARYLWVALEPTGTRSLDDRTLSEFAILVHEVDPELLPRLVVRTRRSCRAAGERLRSMLVDVTCDALFAEHVGFLSAAALRERLEEA
jgi:hypothetical protein